MRKILYGFNLKILLILTGFLIFTIITGNAMSITQLHHVDDVIITWADGPFVLAANRMITIGFIPMIAGTIFEIIFSARTSNNILIRNSGRKEIIQSELVCILMVSAVAFILSMCISSISAFLVCDGNTGMDKISGNMPLAILRVIIINSLEISIVLTVFDILRNIFTKSLPPIIILYAFCSVFGVYPKTSKMSAVFGIKIDSSTYYMEAFDTLGIKVMIVAVLIELVLAGILVMIVKRKDYLR